MKRSVWRDVKHIDTKQLLGCTMFFFRQSAWFSSGVYYQLYAIRAATLSAHFVSSVTWIDAHLLSPTLMIGSNYLDHPWSYLYYLARRRLSMVHWITTAAKEKISKGGELESSVY
jgi:hypothetical protein